jgi:hypothetical protein
MALSISALSHTLANTDLNVVKDFPAEILLAIQLDFNLGRDVGDSHCNQ